MATMTIQELYEWAKELNIEDYEINIQYRDDGGDYYGEDKYVYQIIDSENKRVIL